MVCGKWIFVAALLGLNVPLVQADQILLEKVCAMKERAARDIMSKRQDGESISVQLKYVDLPEYPKESAAAKQMVIDAYQIPRWQAVEKKNMAIEDFANNIALACLKNG